MNTEQMRSEFEVYLKSRYLDGRGYFDAWQERFIYTQPHIQAMWEGWQESRKLISVTLPKAVFEVIKLSKDLGCKGANAYRTQDYVHSKMSEELGEHSVELQIQKGLSYKKAGKDLLHGEAVDLAICCIDSFALEFPEASPEEIFTKFNECMIKKLDKWKRQRDEK